MTRTPARVLVFYSHKQPAYREFARQAPCPVQLLDGAKHFTEQLTMEPGILVIINDMQATHARLVTSWFTRWAHHYDSTIIHLVQNVFDKKPNHRTISLIAIYIVLFRNPRDMSHISHLDKQVNPGGNVLLTAAYHNAMSSRAHSYVVIDFNQSTHEKFRLRNTLFPDEEFPEAFPYGPASQAWEEGKEEGPPLPTERRSLAAAWKGCPVWLVASFAQSPLVACSESARQEGLADGRGLEGLLASTVAPLLFKAVPSIVRSVGSLVLRLKRHRCK